MISRRWKPFACAVLVACSFSAAALLGACAFSQADVAARFSGHEISEEQVNAYTQQFRAVNSLQDDSAWSEYLTSRSLDVRAWREQAIRKIADRMIIEDKASELGIVADTEEVDERIVQAMEQADVAAGDDAAWAEYLESRGQTVQGMRDVYEFSVLEQKVFKEVFDYTESAENDLCDEYIHDNLADQVLRRYGAIEFARDDKKAAQACLDELEAMGQSGQGDRFEQLAQQTGAVSQAIAADGDLGWDFAYDEASIDPKLKLRTAMLEPGALFDAVLVGEDARRIVRCEDVVRVSADIAFEDIDSESFKALVRDYVTTTLWAQQCNDYLAQLEDAANIQVSEIPDDLPYDVL